MKMVKSHIFTNCFQFLDVFPWLEVNWDDFLSLSYITIDMHHSKLWRVCVWNQYFEALYESITKCKPVYHLFKDQNIMLGIKMNNAFQNPNFISNVLYQKIRKIDFQIKKWLKPCYLTLFSYLI